MAHWTHQFGWSKPETWPMNFSARDCGERSIRRSTSRVNIAFRRPSICSAGLSSINDGAASAAWAAARPLPSKMSRLPNAISSVWGPAGRPRCGASKSTTPKSKNHDRQCDLLPIPRSCPTLEIGNRLLLEFAVFDDYTDTNTTVRPTSCSWRNTVKLGSPVSLRFQQLERVPDTSVRFRLRRRKNRQAGFVSVLDAGASGL